MTVYIVRAGDDGLVKIGRTSDVRQRLSLLQNGCPAPLKTLLLLDGQHREERRLHDRYADLRRFGEWFEFDQSMVDGTLFQEGFSPYVEQFAETWFDHPLQRYMTANGMERETFAKKLRITKTSLLAVMRYPDHLTPHMIRTIYAVTKGQVTPNDLYGLHPKPQPIVLSEAAE